MSNKQLKYIIFTGLFVTPFVPFIVSPSLFFPFIAGKAFAFRILIEIVFACYLVLAIRDESYRPKLNWIFWSFLAFIIVIGLADIFAQNPIKAFWSNYERSEGYILILHLAAFFIVMGSMLKTKEMWNKLFATSLGASVIMSIYGFLQLTGKIAINQGGVRVDGTLGNASYLGIYMALHIFIAALLFVRSNFRWQKILISIATLADLIILYFTATRGAILGFIGGAFMALIFVLLKSEKGDKIRKFSIIGLSGLVIFIGLFVAFKENHFIKNSPVMGRFASLSFSEIKTQGRYYVWPMAIKGIMEKPVLGWGQEGFNFVFNKYFDPKMYNQEPWFDRAHNTYLDWAIAGGLLGLLSYLSIIFFVFYYTIKSSELEKREKATVIGFVFAYLFNNLFVFDQLSSYVLFFTILAYVYNFAPETNQALPKQNETNYKKPIIVDEKTKPIFEALILIFLVASIYFAVYKPWQQNKDLLALIGMNNQNKIGTIKDYTKPLNDYVAGFPESLEFVSQTAMSMATNQNVSQDLRGQIFDATNKAFQKQIKNVPNDARYRLFYGMFLSRFGWYGRAVEQLREALKLSPGKQGIAFELINNLLMDGKGAEAFQVAKNIYEEEPSYEEAKFAYGLVAMSVGQNQIAEKIFNEIGQSKLILDDRYLSVLINLGQYEKAISVAKQRINLEPSNIQHRITLTVVYLKANRRNEAIQTLQEIIKLEPSFKERGEYYINEIKAGRNP